jgi:methyl-accepting chemotaxis protein
MENKTLQSDFSKYKDNNRTHSHTNIPKTVNRTSQDKGITNDNGKRVRTETANTSASDASDMELRMKKQAEDISNVSSTMLKLSDTVTNLMNMIQHSNKNQEFEGGEFLDDEDDVDLY